MQQDPSKNFSWYGLFLFPTIFVASIFLLGKNSPKCQDTSVQSQQLEERTEETPQNENSNDNINNNSSETCILEERVEVKQFLDFNKLEYVTSTQESYNDPNNSGNKLFRVHRADLDKYVSPHFKLRELIAS